MCLAHGASARITIATNDKHSSGATVLCNVHNAHNLWRPIK